MRRLDLLDLKLIFFRQPVMASLLGIIVFLVAAVWQQPVMPPASQFTAGVDPLNLLAAQRNFRALFITPADLAGTQQSVLAAAAAHQLNVGQVDYTQELDTAGGFTLASMRLPVQGRYGDIRAFIDEVLAAQQALAIRHLTIQRETVEPGIFSLNATLTVQFLVGEASR